MTGKTPQEQEQDRLNQELADAAFFLGSPPEDVDHYPDRDHLPGQILDLLEQGADVNTIIPIQGHPEGTEPLVSCLIRNRVNILFFDQVLLHKPDLHRESSAGISPLMASIIHPLTHGAWIFPDNVWNQQADEYFQHIAEQFPNELMHTNPDGQNVLHKLPGKLNGPLVRVNHLPIHLLRLFHTHLAPLLHMTDEHGTFPIHLAAQKEDDPFLSVFLYMDAAYLDDTSNSNPRITNDTFEDYLLSTFQNAADVRGGVLGYGDASMAVPDYNDDNALILAVKAGAIENCCSILEKFPHMHESTDKNDLSILEIAHDTCSPQKIERLGQALHAAKSTMALLYQTKPDCTPQP